MNDLLTLDLDGLEELTGCTVSVFGDFPPFRIYQLDWPNGDFLRIYRNGTWLHFDMLQSGDEHRLTQLVSTLPGFFRDREITHFSTNYGGADDAMLKVGFEHGQEHARGYLMHDISDGCRMDEYAAWKRGKRRKPKWRIEVERSISASQRPIPLHGSRS